MRQIDHRPQDGPAVPSPLRVTLVVAVSVFAAELLVMLFLDRFHLSPIVAMLTDSTLLLALCLPALFLLVYRPMVLHLQERRRVEAERERLIIELQQALAQVRTLSGLLPVCAWCKKIRDDGNWVVMEEYLAHHSDAEFTHSMCPECYARHAENLDD